MTKFTVITPVLNGEEFLRDTIDSVNNSSSDPVSHIVVDGGSTDSTLHILREKKEKIVWHSEPDRGISEAFNKGLALATGDYILILNSDDFLEPGILPKVKAFIESCSKQPDVIHGSIRFIEKKYNLQYIEQPNIERMWCYMSVYHPTMFVKKSVYEAIGNYKLDYTCAMDSEWVHRAIKHQINFVEYPGVISNMRLGGVSNRKLGKSLWEFRRSVLSHGGSFFQASYYFVRQLLLHTALKWVPLKTLLVKR